MLGSLYKTFIDELIGRNQSILKMADGEERQNQLPGGVDSRLVTKIAEKTGSDSIPTLTTIEPDNEGLPWSPFPGSTSLATNQTFMPCGNTTCNLDYERCVTEGNVSVCNGTNLGAYGYPERQIYFHLMADNEMTP